MRQRQKMNVSIQALLYQRETMMERMRGSLTIYRYMNTKIIS